MESYIKRNAREQALNCIAEAELQVKQIEEQTEKRTRLVREETRANTQKRIAQERQRLLAQARLEAQQMRVRRREVTIDRVWREARARLSDAGPPTQRLSVLKRLIEDAADQLVGGPLEIRVNARDREVLDPVVVDQIRRDLASGFPVTEIRLSSEAISILGGVEVRRLDMPMVVDNSFERRLSLVEKSLRAQVYHLLTPDDGLESDAGRQDASDPAGQGLA